MPNDSEEYRRECEARYVMKMGDERRNTYYQGVLQKRGKAKANELIDDVNRIRKKEKANVEM
ncbi:hypothetical protein [Nitrosovibrio sp. Nv6]|uniref:DUF7696 family protein n=1 Tax=Nitrosovibrio sp. Nv6 TaxID=1855340 RepID=UPI0008D11D8A|nr:hypothetical protein [Nitrosovibrio sp. Nv6]SEO78401.1 hypothetical protein SAMN05216316_1089 [Nitrosovibrio sp. Nv6]